MADPNASMAEYNKFIAEGQTFEQSANYSQAVECYTHALEAISVAGVLQDDIGKFCYCMRSKCYLQIGKHDEALQDAEAALAIDKDLIKGIYAKAEALYFKGDFEFALLNYHIGNQMRPDMKSFKLGIQKAREAIDNAIGSTTKCSLTVEGDLGLFYSGLETVGKKGKKRGTAGQRRKATARNRSARAAGAQANDKTVKQLLGELYADRAYLESLVNDPSLRLGQGGDIKTLASAGLQYLDKRTEFWRQQKPIYVREKERREQRQRISARTSRMTTARKSKKRPATQETRAKAQQDLERALQAFRSDDHRKCIQLCDDALGPIKEAETREEREIVGLAHSLKGASLFAKDNILDALAEHKKDLEVSVEAPYRLRALCHVGRCSAMLGEFDDAIDVWTQAAGLPMDDVLAAWLQHELGRCHLLRGDTAEALDCASAGLDAANLADNREWKLYLSILKAQALEKVGERTEAHHTYKEAADLAADLYKRDIKTALLRAANNTNLGSAGLVKQHQQQQDEGKEDHTDTTADDDDGDDDDDDDDTADGATGSDGDAGGDQDGTSNSDNGDANES